jgi:hypothetical protein
VSSEPAHLTALSLEQLAEGSLPSAEAIDATAHVDRCGRCAAELESYRNLFAALADLPRFAPSPAFASGVMARVRIAPQEAAVAAWLQRLIPRSKRGWILLATLITAPAAPIFALMGWLMLQPVLSPGMFFEWSLLRGETVAQASFSWLVERAVSSQVVQWMGIGVDTVQTMPQTTLSGLIAFLAIGIPLSAWGLVRLTRTPAARVTYAK